MKLFLRALGPVLATGFLHTLRSMGMTVIFPTLLVGGLGLSLFGPLLPIRWLGNVVLTYLLLVFLIILADETWKAWVREKAGG